MENTIDTWLREGPADERAAWVARNHKRSLTEAEAALVGVVCDAFRLGPWNLSWGSLRGLDVGWHAQVALPRDFSSFDGDALTRLVFAAHDACCRVSVQPCSPTHLRVCLWLRYSRDGELSSRHPTLERAVELWRDRHPAPEVKAIRADVRDGGEA